MKKIVFSPETLAASALESLLAQRYLRDGSWIKRTGVSTEELNAVMKAFDAQGGSASYVFRKGKGRRIQPGVSTDRAQPKGLAALRLGRTVLDLNIDNKLPNLRPAAEVILGPQSKAVDGPMPKAAPKAAPKTAAAPPTKGKAAKPEKAQNVLNYVKTTIVGGRVVMIFTDDEGYEIPVEDRFSYYNRYAAPPTPTHPSTNGAFAGERKPQP